MTGGTAILGLGLVGGSLGLALRAAGRGPVLGLDPDPEAGALALARGAVDRVAGDLADLSGADLWVLAAPVGALEALLARIPAHLAPGAAVTDCASTKVQVARWAGTHLGPALPRFVPGHPVAGSERSGMAAARPDLFQGSRTVLCPGPGTEPGALARTEALWRAVGAHPVRMDARDHDAAYAALSHLPQLLASALVASASRGADLALAGPGLRGMARLAGSSPSLWRDICLSNRGPILERLMDLRGELDQLSAILASADGPSLEAFLAGARTQWEKLGIENPETSRS